ncbi:MAG: hypothetical protein ABIP17_01445 [Ilumatobacteraceae bacterium]
MNRLLATAALATAVLSACGVSAPPPNELAGEIIDTLDELPESVRACMREQLAGYSDQDLESITNDLESENTETKAAAQAALDKFQRDLASCR